MGPRPEPKGILDAAGDSPPDLELGTGSREDSKIRCGVFGKGRCPSNVAPKTCVEYFRGERRGSRIPVARHLTTAYSPPKGFAV